MKKIFFLCSKMCVGGVEKSLLGLLTTIPTDKFEIHLGLLNPIGGFMEYIPKHVIVHHIDCYAKYWKYINDPPMSYIKEYFRLKQFDKAIIHSILYLHIRFYHNWYWFYKYLLRKEPVFKEKFDAAIAFAGPSQMIDYYICEKVDAPKKYGWIHFDVTKFGIDTGMTRKLYKKYEQIFIVSDTAKEKFDSLFPSLKHKTKVFYNIVSAEQVNQMANVAPTFEDSFDGIKIVTVGRLSREKGQDKAVKALKILRDNEINAKWYFVGDGKLRDHCEQLAKELNVEDFVCFLGLQTNPYGYMRDCDIYMQPSLHEGYCITLAEAKIFNRPIVCTDFTGAREQLETYSAPWRIAEHSPESIANSIKSLL